ncbi:MAG: hypothetical protein WC806_03685 [Candidatus Gracilibacteria bacterium]|jgi:hypothetical protein
MSENTQTNNTTLASQDTDPKVQTELNKPLANAQGLTAEEETFLNMLINFVNEGKINLYTPSTLLNRAVYDKLASEQQGKTDLEAINMLSAIREIKGLCDAGYRETYQVANLVQSLKYTKERIEYAGGDLFII